MRILGLDIGDKRTGCAISDVEGKIAFGLDVIKMNEIEAALQKILLKYAPELIVCGIPLTMDGKIGYQAEKVLAFLKKLKKITTLPIVLWDERLSTKEAEKALEELKRDKKKKVIDKIASQLILQSFLDRRNTLQEV